VAKVRFGGLDMLKPHAVEPTKMPRTAVIPVVRDSRTGYLNAGPYSGGVSYLDPLQVLFGPKGSHAIEAFRQADEFCVAVPSKEQVDAMWVMALEVPHGINEIEVAGWHELPSSYIETPGIEECVLNLECKKVGTFPLPSPWRTIFIGEVVGVSVSNRLRGMTRSESVNLFPIHEAGSHPETGLYSPSFYSGELIPSAEAAPTLASGEGHTTVSAADLKRPENSWVRMNAIFPRPTYIVMTADENGRARAQVISGGSLQSTEPALQIPVPKDSPAYRNIRRTGEFVVSIPDRSLIEQIERLEADPDDLAGAGLSLLSPNMVGAQGIAECPISMDCKAVILEDVPGMDYALLVARKVGSTLDDVIATRLDADLYPLNERLTFVNRLYASYLYAVMDRDLKRRWGFHTENPISVRPLPSWGSRYGGWWGPGPSLGRWLTELVDEELITKNEQMKISRAVQLWGNGTGIPHLAEFIDDDMRAELKTRLTKLFGMMAWAHRDYDAWDLVHQYLNTFEEPARDHHSGPLYHEKWWGRV
jgi:flavin reductase (DIM6/NTAB) family NADH-FMN oxidoreductase RutF